MRIRNFVLSVCWLLATGYWLLESGGAQQENELVSAKVPAGPRIDGAAESQVWDKAKALMVKVRDIPGARRKRENDVMVKSVHTNTHIYFLLQWKDETRDVTHRPWVWNEDKKEYEEGDDVEDAASLAFPIEGEFTPDMLAGVESVWDVWHWKAARTDPLGFAMDKRHIYSLKELEDGIEYKARNGKSVWIARPEDKGTSATKELSAPSTFEDDLVPHYQPQRPTMSAADVRAKGRWQQKMWTVEFERKLKTGFDDDLQFDVSKSYPFAIAIFDHEEDDTHTVSGLLTLTFKSQ